MGVGLPMEKVGTCAETSSSRPGADEIRLHTVSKVGYSGASNQVGNEQRDGAN